MLEISHKARQGASVSKTWFGPFDKLKTALRARLPWKQDESDCEKYRRGQSSAGTALSGVAARLDGLKGGGITRPLTDSKGQPTQSGGERRKQGPGPLYPEVTEEPFRVAPVWGGIA